MPSPFPGMDPYLETPEFWPDFHARFVNCWCEAIADLLPAHYEARIDERVSLVETPVDPEWEAAHVRPDVAVTRSAAQTAASAATAVAEVGTLEPVSIPLSTDPVEVRETFIEIRHRPDRTLVAVLELLSPTNKAGIGQGEYLRKRGALIRQPVHLVELDFLVGGERLPTARPLPKGDYFALIARSDRRPMAEVYCWTVRHRLPRIPIPLRAPDPDIRVDLAAVFALTYERGRYRTALRYSEPLQAPLAAADADWCAGQVRLATA